MSTSRDGEAVRTRGAHELPTSSGARAGAAPGAGRPRPPITPPHRSAGLTDAQTLDLYYAMLVARRLSEQCLKLAFQGALDVAIPSEGHEAAQVASMRALTPHDFAYLFYRSVPAAYARGMTAREIMLDSFGRAAGPSSGGKNLPGHWAHPGLNLLSISGSVGTQIPHAVGTALASKIRGEDAVTIVYFGDGGASKADFHEGLNFAAVHRVPVVLFCENNGIAISVPFEKQSPVSSIAERGGAYGVPGVTVDGADPIAVYMATRDAVRRARRGAGPTLIEARVKRLGAHTSQVGDQRSWEEVQHERIEHDPLPHFALYLREQGIMDDAQEISLNSRADAEVADAVAFAADAPSPERSAAFADVYGR